MRTPTSPKMPDNIEEYFAKIEGTKEAFHSRELFKADEDSVDLKTHLKDEEIALINILMFNDILLKEAGLKSVYAEYLYKYMRLKISKDRLSRQEFVSINKTHTPEDMLSTMSNIKNITDVKR